MAAKSDLIVILTDVEKELALRNQHKAVEIVSTYKKRFVKDLLNKNTNPEFPLHSVIYDLLMRLLESK